MAVPRGGCQAVAASWRPLRCRHLCGFAAVAAATAAIHTALPPPGFAPWHSWCLCCDCCCHGGCHARHRLGRYRPWAAAGRQGRAGDGGGPERRVGLRREHRAGCRSTAAARGRSCRRCAAALSCVDRDSDLPAATGRAGHILWCLRGVGCNQPGHTQVWCAQSHTCQANDRHDFF